MRLFASALVALWIVSWCEALVVPAAPGLRVRGRARRVRAGASFDDVPQPAPKIRYSGGDWWPQLRSAPRSKILRRVQSHVWFNVAIACAAAAWRGGGRDALPGALHSLTAGSLSLLLVFRTNAAYDRWWEARKAWGLVLAASRDAARLARTLEREDDARRICAALCAFPELLRLHVTNRPRAVHTELAREACRAAGMDRGDVDRCVRARHRALECTTLIGDARRGRRDVRGRAFRPERTGPLP